MAEAQQEAPTNGLSSPPPPPPPPPQTQQPETGGAPAAGTVSKRQRRPSVRLGEIGDQPAAIHQDPWRRAKQWKPSLESRLPNPRFHPSKPHPMAADLILPSENQSVDHDALETLGLASKRGIRDAKSRRRPRPGLIQKDGPRPAADSKLGGEEVGDDGLPEGPEIPAEEADGGDDDTPSGTDGGDWNYNWDGHSGSLEDGSIRTWLNRLGLGRYAPVFEIHEVDDEVLPLLTLEDLKDMGINAVGSRRKMYCAIQKLRKSS